MLTPMGEPWWADPGEIAALAIYPHAARIASGSDDGTIALWSSPPHLPDTACPCDTVAPSPCPPSHGGSVRSLAVSADGRWLVSGGQDGTVMVRSLTTSPATNPATSPATSPATNPSPVQILRGHEFWVLGVAVDPGDPEGDRLASIGADYTVRLWERKTGRCLAIGRGHEYWGAAVAFLPTLSADSSQLVSVGYDGTLRWWQWDGVSSHRANWMTHAASAEGKTPADRKTFANSETWANRKTWADPETPAERQTSGSLRLVRTVVASADHLYAVAVSDDGRAIATGGADRRVRIWDAATGECLDDGENAPDGGHGAPVLALAALPGAAAWVSGSGDSTIRLWVDPRSPQPHRWGSRGEVVVGAVNCPWAVAVSPDGQWLAAGNADAPVRLWHLPERRYLGAIEIPGAAISTAAIPTGNIHPEDLHPEDLHPEDLHPEDLHPEDLHPKDLHPEDIHPEDIHPGDLDIPPNAIPSAAIPAGVMADDRALAVVFGRSTPCDRTLILGSDHGQIYRVPLPPSPRQWAIASDRGRITAITFTPVPFDHPIDHCTNHPLGLLTGGTGSPHLDAWDAQTGQHLGTHIHPDHTLVLQSDRPGQYLARGSDTGLVQVWPWAQLWAALTAPNTTPPTPPWQRRAAPWVSAIVFLADSPTFPDSPDLIWATLSGGVTRANVQTGVQDTLGTVAAGVRSLAVVGEWLWLGRTDGHLEAWHLTTGARSPLPDPHTQDVLAIGVPQCPDQPVITVGREGTVVARSRRSGRAIATSLVPGGEIHVAAGAGHPMVVGFAWPGRIGCLGRSSDSSRSGCPTPQIPPSHRTVS